MVLLACELLRVRGAPVSVAGNDDLLLSDVYVSDVDAVSLTSFGFARASERLAEATDRGLLGGDLALDAEVGRDLTTPTALSGEVLCGCSTAPSFSSSPPASPGAGVDAMSDRSGPIPTAHTPTVTPLHACIGAVERFEI